MKLSFVLFILFSINYSLAQNIEKIVIPKGVVYNYCDNNVIDKAKILIANNLSDDNNYKLMQDNLIVGPELWKRFKNNINIQKIEKGKVQFHVDDLILEGKMSQTKNESKIIWDELKKEISKDYKIRKANELELKYYWSIISFDIDEPLLIIESNEHKYILNILEKDLKLMWLEEVPSSKLNENQSKNTVAYLNGNEVDSVSEGIKETKLEKLVLLSSDDELKKNSSIEDLKLIIDKTNKIFDDLFKNSKKEGKIMVLFELNKNKNEIQFAVKNDLDLEIMKEFESRVKSENYPNSKLDSIQFKLIYKVNSFNDIN